MPIPRGRRRPSRVIDLSHATHASRVYPPNTRVPLFRCGARVAAGLKGDSGPVADPTPPEGEYSRYAVGWEKRYQPCVQRVR